MDYAIIIIFTITIIVVPTQILLFLCLIWFRGKVDKYEDIALKLIDKYIDNSAKNNHAIQNSQNSQVIQNLEYTRNELLLMVGKHNKIRLDSNLEDYFPELYITNEPQIIITQFKKINELCNDKTNDKKINILNKWIVEKPLIGTVLDLASMLWLYFMNDNLQNLHKFQNLRH